MLHLFNPAAKAAVSAAVAVVTALGCAAAARAAAPQEASFTIAVIPDTQNYIDYTHQRAAGFPFNGKDLLIQQLQYVADHLKARGGDIAFVTAMGDVWQHQSLPMDPEHQARGFKRAPNPAMEGEFPIGTQVREIEMPAAREGYRLLHGKTPFSVVPGNHDYDSMWTDSAHPPKPVVKSEADIGMLHSSGLTNFVSVFGAESEFFKGMPWYVAAHDKGADSAQIFTAGGQQFLHIGLQFDPPDASLEWAAKILQQHPKLPAIISTHDYMVVSGAREPNPIIDNHAVDPKDNTPQMVWDKLIRKHDQIFLVLCGHEHGQAFRVDDNDAGHKVYQVLADYQDRHQTAVDAGAQVNAWLGIGDGWMRLMSFDMRGARPAVHVHTYSTFYKKESIDTPEYAAWYKAHEKPAMTDAEFHAQDDFSFTLDDFNQRFGHPKGDHNSEAQ